MHNKKFISGIDVHRNVDKGHSLDAHRGNGDDISVPAALIKQKKKRYGVAYGSLLLLLGGLLLANICMGSVTIPLEGIFRFIKGEALSQVEANILFQIRLPRALSAAILGGALGLSGYLLQTFFHNPIAGPFVLGISSGAKLTVALVMVFLLGQAVKVSSAALILSAFFGAFLSMGFVLLMAKAVDKMSMLIVSGVMIGYICSAITDFVVTFADDADIVNLHNWSKGSFSGMSWENVSVMAVVVFVSTVCVLFLAKPIGAFGLGEGYARAMGVDVGRLKVALVLLSSILAACITAFAGPVSFVGIAVPHLVKQLFGTIKPLIMIPATFLGGSVFCLFCDLLARTIFAPTELSISTVTAVFGAPVVIIVLLRKKER